MANCFRTALASKGSRKPASSGEIIISRDSPSESYLNSTGFPPVAYGAAGLFRTKNTAVTMVVSALVERWLSRAKQMTVVKSSGRIFVFW